MQIPDVFNHICVHVLDLAPIGSLENIAIHVTFSALLKLESVYLAFDFVCVNDI